MRQGRMRHGGWLLLAAVGCGGHGGDETGVTTGDDDDNGTGDVTIDCSVVPQFDLPALNCEQIAAAFVQVTQAGSACNVNADCSPVHPNCADWADVGCYYPVNKCVSSALVAQFSTEAAGCVTATGQVGNCQCSGAPEVFCVDHHCCSPGSADGDSRCLTPP